MRGYPHKRVAQRRSHRLTKRSASALVMLVALMALAMLAQPAIR
jgi:hypothetical protein